MKRSLERTPLYGLSAEKAADFRRRGIESGECSAIFGLDPFKSSFTLWAEKSGKLPCAQESETARFDRDNRGYVAKRFSQATGKAVRRVDAALHNPLYPFAWAELHYIVLGEDAGLSCHCVSHLSLSSFRRKMYPKAFYYPCLHRMMVTGRKKWYLAVLVLQKELRIFEFTADDAEVSCLAQGERQFWKRVTEDCPPLPDSSRSTKETLDTLYPGKGSRCVDLSPISLQIHDYLSWQEQLKACQDVLGRREAIIKSFLGDAQRGHLGNIQVSWAAEEEDPTGSRIFRVHRAEGGRTPYDRST